MKKTLTLATAALLALPLFAADGAKKKETAAPAPTTQAVKTQAAPAPVADSPLVAAANARRARRAASRINITNETLAKSNGKAHITTTASQKPVPVIPPSPMSLEQRWANERAEQQRRASVEAAKRAEAEQARQAEIRRTHDILEDMEYSEDDIDADPARAEHRARLAAEGKKENEQKPPHR